MKANRKNPFNVVLMGLLVTGSLWIVTGDIYVSYKK
jgi:hypothetical protein